MANQQAIPAPVSDTAHPSVTPDPYARVCVIGAGARFLSGISVYTCRLSNALAATHDVSAILMRQLLPTRLYPGKDRVGADLSHLSYDREVKVFDGVDWYWIPSLFRALWFLLRQRPAVTVFQWWTGTVVHSYLILALFARLIGSRIVIEFHEVQDPGEGDMPLARAYVRLMAPLLVRLADGFMVHSAVDHTLLEQHYPIQGRPVAVLRHGPHDHYQRDEDVPPFREAPPEACNLLFFGLIRPYKGLDDLIRAFDALPPEEIDRYWLTIVGETWEGWTLPAELIAQSRYRDRITFVNHYVHDEEVGPIFAGADAVVLPYHRSSISGALHVAMGYGLPVVVSDVGGLTETVEHYGGALLVPPADHEALVASLKAVMELRGQRFSHPYTWQDTAKSFDELFAALPSRRTAVEAGA